MGVLFDAIPENERQLIINYIEAYAGYDKEYDSPNEFIMFAPLSHILRFWDKNKSDLYTLMGHNLILKRDITYKIDDETLLACFDEYESEGDISNFLNELTDCHNLRLIKERANYENSYYDITRLLRNVDLAENIFSGPSFTLGKIAIPEGCKTVRILGKIIKEYLPELSEEYEAFRIEHSRLLNQRSLTGTLCLSIHPLDYITMSDNDCDWESCMSWMQGGDYRMGTVEMMNSPIVIEAYLTSKTDMAVPGGTWNNKKWRCLYIVNTDVIAEIRSYPYLNEYLSRYCMDWIKNLAQENLGWTYQTDTFEYHKGQEVDGHIINFYCNSMYNDFRFTHLLYLSDKPFGKTLNVGYSGPNECMCCGEAYLQMEEESYLLCHSCLGMEICENCGRLEYSQDMYEVDGNWICSTCYEEEVYICPGCEEDRVVSCHLYTDDWEDRTIYLMNEVEHKIYPFYKETFCPDCYQKMVKGEMDIGDIKIYRAYDSNNKFKYYNQRVFRAIKYPSLNKHGREIFDVSGIDFYSRPIWTHIPIDRAVLETQEMLLNNTIYDPILNESAIEWYERDLNIKDPFDL